MTLAAQVFWPVLAGTSGAVGGMWMRRSFSGALPGALLAWAWYYSISYSLLSWHLSANHWTRLVLLVILGWVSGRLAGRRQRKMIDLPLDLRLGFALLTGFATRGVLLLCQSVGAYYAR